MSEKLNWGIIGTGNIAHTFANGVAASSTGKVIAVGSRDQASADKFGDEFNVPNRHGSYDALLADPAVQAVYISTPHPMHKEWAIKAANAKKHILCEKPIGVNALEAQQIIDAAKKNDVFLMEAFMYRCHPQIDKLVELIRDKAIGQVRVIQATFSFNTPKYDESSRLLSPELAGGGILDVGCYPASFSRLVAGAAVGLPFADPTEVVATGHLGRTGVDEWTTASAKFPHGIVAQLAAGVQCDCENVARVFGSEGWIFMPVPWNPSLDGAPAKIVLNVSGKPAQEIVVPTPAPLYALEIDLVATHLAKRQVPPPAMSWDDTLGNMRMLDAWRKAIGLRYPFESA